MNSDGSNEIERAKLEIERERLELDKSRLLLENKFFKANSGVLISAAVSLAALIVSLGQVWVTQISKSKELEMAQIQKQTEMNQQREQKEKELAVLDNQRKRDWDLSAAKFVTDSM